MTVESFDYTLWETNLTPKEWITTTASSAGAISSNKSRNDDEQHSRTDRLHGIIRNAHSRIETTKIILDFICAGSEHLAEYIDKCHGDNGDNYDGRDDQEMPLSFWQAASLMVVTLFRIDDQDIVQKAHEDRSLAIDKLSILFDALVNMKNNSVVNIMTPLLIRCGEILNAIDMDRNTRKQRLKTWNDSIILPIWSTKDFEIIASSNPVSTAVIGSAYLHSLYSLGIPDPNSNRKLPWRTYFALSNGFLYYKPALQTWPIIKWIDIVITAPWIKLFFKDAATYLKKVSDHSADKESQYYYEYSLPPFVYTMILEMVYFKGALSCLGTGEIDQCDRCEDNGPVQWARSHVHHYLHVLSRRKTCINSSTARLDTSTEHGSIKLLPHVFVKDLISFIDSSSEQHQYLVKQLKEQYLEEVWNADDDKYFQIERKRLPKDAFDIGRKIDKKSYERFKKDYRIPLQSDILCDNQQQYYSRCPLTISKSSLYFSWPLYFLEEIISESINYRILPSKISSGKNNINNNNKDMKAIRGSLIGFFQQNSGTRDSLLSYVNRIQHDRHVEFKVGPYNIDIEMTDGTNQEDTETEMLDIDSFKSIHLLRPLSCSDKYYNNITGLSSIPFGIISTKLKDGAVEKYLTKFKPSGLTLINNEVMAHWTTN